MILNLISQFTETSNDKPFPTETKKEPNICKPLVQYPVVGIRTIAAYVTDIETVKTQTRVEKKKKTNYKCDVCHKKVTIISK